MHRPIFSLTSTLRSHHCQELVRLARPGGLVLVSAWAQQPDQPGFGQGDTLVPWTLRSSDPSGKAAHYWRYYHLFGPGELATLGQACPGAIVVNASQDGANWFLLLRKHLSDPLP